MSGVSFDRLEHSGHSLEILQWNDAEFGSATIAVQINHSGHPVAPTVKFDTMLPSQPTPQNTEFPFHVVNYLAPPYHAAPITFPRSHIFSLYTVSVALRAASLACCSI